MDKLRMESTDMTEQNIEKIGRLFPNVITESRDKDGNLKKAINFDLLKQLLSADVLKGDEAYDFTWVGKKASIIEANKPIRETLRPSKEESKNWDTTGNLYIEGDNLDVLKLLQESYLEKVKMIYIDPPYNTGNDFVYRDNFTRDKDEYHAETGVYDEHGDRLFRNTESNGRFHSDWCSMMLPRLQLARNLLRDDGVIFISIDDNEVAQLIKICNEVFGEHNTIGTIIQNKQNAKNDTTDIQKNHEFILVYRKMARYDRAAKIIPTIIRTVQKFRDVYEDNGDYFFINDPITTRGMGGILSARPNLGYTIYFNPSTNEKVAVCDYDVSKAKTAINYEDIYTNCGDLLSKGFVAIRPPKVRGQLGVWTWSLEKFNEENKNIIITGKPGAYSVKKRTFVNRESIRMIKGKLQYVEYENANVRSIWDYSTNNGTIALNNVMESSNIFDNAKNLDMLTECVKLVPDDDFIIIDFFSGSATTAHAVMQANSEDGGSRKFIMVQLPEKCANGTEAAKAGYKNICEIGKERIRRAGEKIKADSGILAQNLDIGFRVFKLDSTNMKDVYFAAKDYSQGQLKDLISNIKEDRTDMDLLFACLLKWGLPLSLAHKTEKIDGFDVHTINDGDLMACFADEVSEAVIREIAKRQPLRVVFRDSSFGTSPEKINVEEIFKLMSPKTTVKVI